MKVLYLGHFLEGSSWSTSASEYLKALSLYCEVSWRPIRINSNISPDSIKHLYGNLNNITHNIQHILPSYMEKNKKSVGILIQETDSIKHTGWQEKLNLMDQVWSPTFRNEKYKVIPHCTDINKYTKKYPNILQNMKDKYIFYTIVDFNRRKRLSATIEAFHLAFNKNDNVELIIKSNKKGFDSNQIHSEISSMNDSVKKQLRLHNKYKDPIIVTSYFTDEQIYSLHQDCDCFVSSSFGEAFCYPVLDAMGFNNYVITSNTIDYLENGSIITGQKEPCLGADEYVPNLHSGLENWESVSILKLSQEMRKIYETQPKVQNDMTKFSYEEVGKIMYNNLEAL